MTRSPVSYKRHRFPPALIAHTVWLYFRFSLNLRLVEEMLLERGIVVSYETVRCKEVRSRLFWPPTSQPQSRSDIWHLDEAVVTIGGKKRWLWRAVNQDGCVLDEIVQNRRNNKAAKRLLVRLLKKQSLAPKRMITDKLRSYAAANARSCLPSSTVPTKD